jgi:RNA polymerase sigma factor FliA
LTVEQQYKHMNQRFRHSASDKEICTETEMTLDKFRQLSDRIKRLKIEPFQTPVSRNSAGGNDPLFHNIFGAPNKMFSPVICHKSEIREKLTKAIEALPKTEKLIVSLYYHDELTLKEIAAVLKTSESGISRLYTIAMLRIQSKLRE